MSDIFDSKDVAARYDTARALPQETIALWMNALKQHVPADEVNSVLDLGAGTGRFTATLQEIYGCPVIALEPSEEMLGQGRNRGLQKVQWLCGPAENIPLEAESVDLVWMSQVFHHLDDRSHAFMEIARILKPAGFLGMRNSILENEPDIAWYEFFPEVRESNDANIPARDDIIRCAAECGLELILTQTVNQLFAASYEEYYDKIAGRGLSPLIRITRESFQEGLARFRKWIDSQPGDRPVYEPIELFVFRKKT